MLDMRAPEHPMARRNIVLDRDSDGPETAKQHARMTEQKLITNG